MTENRVYNFAPGPSIIAEDVLMRARDEMMNYHSSGMSVMEMSHRSKMFADIFSSTKENFKKIFGVPDTHEVLFLQGGATTQFAAIPMNLLCGGTADYAVTGNFSGKAAKEAKKYGTVNIACDTGSTGHDRIPTQSELSFTPDAKYFYYCANNTIYGSEWQYVPQTDSVLVCDMSSDIMSRKVDVSKFGLIYAGAQKNMAPAGLTVVIIDRSLAGNAMAITPEIMDYSIMIKHDSMLNTPPCWCIYMLGLTLEWLEKQGGVEGMEQLKHARAEKIYSVLDESSFYTPHVLPGSRSDMNITFKTPSEELDALFVKEAAEKGLANLKGHRITGGLRASLYNAMPMEGADALAEFMKEFEVKHNV